MGTMGVYILRNRLNGKVYVGSSTWIERRIEQHMAMMRAGCHPNPRISGAVTWSGIENFEWKVVERVSRKSQLPARELAWIRHHNAVRHGYNQTYDTRRDGKRRRRKTVPELAAVALIVVAILVVLAA